MVMASMSAMTTAKELERVVSPAAAQTLLMASMDVASVMVCAVRLSIPSQRGL